MPYYREIHITHKISNYTGQILHREHDGTALITLVEKVQSEDFISDEALESFARSRYPDAVSIEIRTVLR